MKNKDNLDDEDKAIKKLFQRIENARLNAKIGVFVGAVTSIIADIVCFSLIFALQNINFIYPTAILLAFSVGAILAFCNPAIHEKIDNIAIDIALFFSDKAYLKKEISKNTQCDTSKNIQNIASA